MSNGKIGALQSLCAFAAGIVLLGLQAATAADRQAEVRQAAGQFYAALNVLFTGDVAPMLAVWSHADDVTYMGPLGGLLVGWVAVRASWEGQANSKLGGRVKPEALRVIATESMGITVGYERGTNNVNGKPVRVDIRATNIFRREDGRWKMIGHHTDVFSWLKLEGEK